MKGKTLTLALVLILAYYGSFLLLGQHALVNNIKEDSHSSYNTYRWTPHVKLISNIDLEPGELSSLNDLWLSPHLNVTFEQVDNLDQVQDFNKKDTYHYFLMINAKALPWIRLKECEKIEEYAACWQIDYVWCFFTWLKIGEESQGIS